jgi:hypothetical protein
MMIMLFASNFLTAQNKEKPGNLSNSESQLDLLELFALDGSKNIMTEETFGIINEHITTRVNYRDVGTISGLFAPPYASSDFLLELRLFGEKVQTKNYRWYPFEVIREGEINGVQVSTSTVLTDGKRAGVIEIKLCNQNDQKSTASLQFHIQGGLNDVNRWEFARPDARGKTSNEVTDGTMVKQNQDGRIVIKTDIPGLTWFELGSRWDTRITLLPGEEIRYHIAFEMGAPGITGEAADLILSDPGGSIQTAREAYKAKVDDLLAKLPEFSSDNKKLEKYYYRSLVVLITNKWRVPEFVLDPYYGSGAIIGGCVGNYLWEFGLPAQIFPLYDPVAYKNHIKQFLKIDITKHFLFDPMTGAAGGPWYPVNQDKIIESIYYYVIHTGDLDFLKEVVDGMSVYEHVKKNALFGDDLRRPVTLVDYGDKGEHHLELRRGFPYRGIMPDLNGLRYLTYMRAYELMKLAGKPIQMLPERAEGVKSLLKKELWSPENKWFYFQYDNKKDIRLTNFIYLLIGTGIFDQDVESDLLSRLNETEFLSEFGIHSISKTDPAYDQVDIDHGGGGSYVAFPPLICQRLYNAGYTEQADDLLERHLWWGERLPYWGDSKVANYMGYREDTPLQSDFDATSGAQTIIFGLFGVKVSPNGAITINPVKTGLTNEMALKGLKIRGKTIDIFVRGEQYKVTTDGKTFSHKLGTPLVIEN